MTNLPEFKYHPDPLATGSIVPSEETCECCGEARGFVYCTPPYGERDIEFLCPWCIADGSADTKLGASFSDSWPLSQSGVSQKIIDEVTLRTPGYVCWQQESWVSCCDDACEFHGDAIPSELEELNEDERKRVAGEFDVPLSDFNEMLTHYAPKGSPAIYKFRCRHCGVTHYNWDCM